MLPSSNHNIHVTLCVLITGAKVLFHGTCIAYTCLPLSTHTHTHTCTNTHAHTHANPFSIAVITKGKYGVLEADALPQLVALLHDEDSEVRLNSIKASPENVVHIYSFFNVLANCA